MYRKETNNIDNFLGQQQEWINNYQPGLRIREQGTVVSVGDGIPWIVGLPSAAMEEITEEIEVILHTAENIRKIDPQFSQQHAAGINLWEYCPRLRREMGVRISVTIQTALVWCRLLTISFISWIRMMGIVISC